jgi:hypothetical protein
MHELPKVIASSVVRSTQQGESHGGLYLVDLEIEKIDKVIDWNTVDINWEGRGKDRGLRGIAFYKDQILLAASNEIYVFDKLFNKIKSYSNKYLNHCHEIFVADDQLYVTSTGFDSILEFDMQSELFTRGFEIRFNNSNWILNKIWQKFFKENLVNKPNLKIFDPNSDFGPKQFDQIHLNNVVIHNDYICVSGRRTNKIFGIKDEMLSILASISMGTHNASLMGDDGRVIMNDTNCDLVRVTNREGICQKKFNIPMYSKEKLEMNNIPKDHARQGFGRGLAIYEDDFLIIGSSPATITVFDLASGKIIKSINLSMDVRNAIHGLEIWPFD